MARFQETVEAMRALNERPYMANEMMGHIANEEPHHPEADDVVPLLLTKQQVARMIIMAMTAAAVFDAGYATPDGSVQSLELAKVLGDQAFTVAVDSHA